MRRRPFDAGFLLGAGLPALLYLWLAQGSFSLAARVGEREHYYTYAALGLVHGRLDVPYQALGNECFLLKDRCMGYYGITPSLLRLPLVVLGGNRTLTDATEALFFLLGFAATALGLWWLCRQLLVEWAPRLPDRLLGALGFAAAAGGLLSPLLFLVSRPLVYEEAILWGVAFAAIALAAATSLRFRPRTSTLVILLVADLLGVLARPTVGASAVVATAVVGAWFLRAGWPERRAAGGDARRSVIWGGCLIAGAVVAFAAAPALAYAKFGTFSVPYRYHVNLRNHPAVLATVDHPGGVNVAALPTKLLSILRPDSLRISPHRPFVALGEAEPTVLWPARWADVGPTWELTSSITATLPFTTTTATIGLAWAILTYRRRPAGAHGDPGSGSTATIDITIVLVVSAAAALLLGLLFPGQTYRYIADWLPLLCIGGVVGLAAVAMHPPPTLRGRRLLLGAGAALLAAQLVIQVGVAIPNALKVGEEEAATCLRGPDPNPYGVLGKLFCPR